MLLQPLRQSLKLASSQALIFVVALATLAGAVILGLLIAQNGPDIVPVLLLGVAGVLFAGLLFFRPFFGLVFLLASMPLQAKYPDVPIFSSVLSLVGLVTLAGHLFQNRLQFEVRYLLRPQFLLGLAFILWMTFTNVQAATAGASRNWLWTYVQLLMLVWLSAELIPPDKQHILMICCIATGCLNAALSIPEAHITGSLVTTVRGGADLTGNQDETALFLIFALAFAMYLGAKAKNWTRFLFPLIIALLSLGIVVTVSRTGFIMLVAVLVLMFLLLPSFAKEPKSYLALIRSRMIWVVGVGLVALVIVPGSYWQILEETIRMSGVPTRDVGTTSWNDTSVVRYALWDSAIRMWRDYPIVGVGIGQFTEYNRFYINADFSHYVDKVPHNMYLTVLVETGVVGAVIYLLWLLASCWDLLRIMLRSKSREMVGLSATWFTTFIAFCIHGLTSTTQYYKPIWMFAGISTALWVLYQQEKSQALAGSSAGLQAATRQKQAAEP